MEAQCKGGVRADGVASLIVAAGERRVLLGVEFENMMRSWVMKLGAQQGLSVVASRWLGGREGQGARKGNGVRGLRLPSPPWVVQNFLMYFGFLS